MQNVGIKNAYEDLANEIVLRAVKDYKRSLAQLKKNPGNKNAQQGVKRGEDFLFSPWFETLTDVDPTYLIHKLQEE